MIADGNHGHEKVGAHANDGEVAGTLAHDEEQIFLGIETQRGRRISSGNGKAFARVADDAAIVNVYGGDAARGGV